MSADDSLGDGHLNAMDTSGNGDWNFTSRTNTGLSGPNSRSHSRSNSQLGGFSQQAPEGMTPCVSGADSFSRSNPVSAAPHVITRSQTKSLDMAMAMAMKSNESVVNENEKLPQTTGENFTPTRVRAPPSPKKQVRFEPYPVNVIYWESAVKQRIFFQETFAAFQYYVKYYFEEQLEDSPFRIYSLPYKDAPLEQRKHIQTEEDYCELRNKILEMSNDRILVFRDDGVSSPRKVPFLWSNYKALEAPKKLRISKWDETDIDDAASLLLQDSRDSEQSEECKYHDKCTCLLCHFNPCEGTGLDAVHLFTVDEFKSLAKPVRTLLLYNFDLLFGLNDFANMVTLCKCCHKHFDAHGVSIAVNNGAMTWDVLPYLWDTTATSSTKFRSFHLQPVQFRHRPWRMLPTLGVVQHRHRAALQGKTSCLLETSMCSCLKKLLIFRLFTVL